MYGNIVYNYKDSSIWYSTWDEDGNKTDKIVPFKPYLFVKDSHSHDAISIYEESLQKVEFNDAGSRRRFCETTKKTYFNLPACQQFLIDTFKGKQDSDDFSKNPLRVFFLDIETYSPNGFPDPMEAKDEIVVITVYDSITKHYTVFGNGYQYYAKDDDVIYHYFPDEDKMLRGFVRWWRKRFPDIVSGWYSFGFDLPYICNRLARIYGDEFAAAKLSPVGRAWHKEDCKKRFGAVERIYDQLWNIEGVTHIDMQAAYYKFSPKKLESYSLNSVCSAEGLGQKLEYDGSLSEWWINNPREFIDYNIQDVRLLVNLENKLKYMQLCRHMSYSALAPIGDALSTLPIITGLEALEALKRDRIISSFDNSDAKVEFEGGYVAEPKIGFSRSIVSLDVNSLYPSAIRTLNISNETKVGWFDVSEDRQFVDVRTVTGKSKRFTRDQFVDFLKKSDVTLAPNGVLYSQRIQGIIPALVERLYSVRKSTKKKMLELEKKASEMRMNGTGTEEEIQRIEDEASFLNIRQWLAKIQLNSIYGAMGEKHGAMFDLDLSKSITSLGREVIKKTADIVNKKVGSMIGEESYDATVYQDTDSAYITIEPILKKRGVDMISDGKINPDVYPIVDEISDYVNSEIENFLKRKRNCKNPCIVFKREAIAPNGGIWLAKKMYALHVMDDEGVICDKITYHGMSVVRSSTPEKVKPMIRGIIESAIKTQDRSEIVKLAKKYWSEYQNLTTLEKSVAIGCNNIQEYYDKGSRDKDGKFVPAKGTPRQVVAGIMFNELLVAEGLDKKYEKITEGDKLRIIYVKEPNRFGLKSFAFKKKIPTEWEKDLVIDDKTMFLKTVWSCVQKCFEVVGWPEIDPTLDEAVDLNDILGL